MNKTKSILSKSHLEHFYLFYALFFPSVRTLTIVHMVWIVWLERGRWEIMRRKRKTNTNTQFRAWNSRCHSFIILYSSWQLLSLAITIFEFYSRVVVVVVVCLCIISIFVPVDRIYRLVAHSFQSIIFRSACASNKHFHSHCIPNMPKYAILLRHDPRKIAD